MNRIVFLFFSLCWLCGGIAQGADTAPELEVADPYIELHTGPHRGYPIFHVVERGARVQVLKRRTGWFKVRTAGGKEGWVAREQMAQTLTPEGEPLKLAETTVDAFSRRRWEMGLMGGDFEGARVVTVYGSYAFTPGLSGELMVSHALGDFSSSVLAGANLVAQPFPEWRFSPFFKLGTGVINTDPRVTLVQAEDRLDQVAHVGVGLRTYLTRKFILRVEYNNYVVFQSDDNNEEVNEWKAGFAFFF